MFGTIIGDVYGYAAATNAGTTYKEPIGEGKFTIITLKALALGKTLREFPSTYDSAIFPHMFQTNLFYYTRLLPRYGHSIPMEFERMASIAPIVDWAGSKETVMKYTRWLFDDYKGHNFTYIDAVLYSLMYSRIYNRVKVKDMMLGDCDIKNFKEKGNTHGEYDLYEAALMAVVSNTNFEDVIMAASEYDREHGDITGGACSALAGGIAEIMYGIPQRVLREAHSWMDPLVFKAANRCYTGLFPEEK